MGFFINGKVVDDANSNYSDALKYIRYLTKDDDLDKISQQGIYKTSIHYGLPANNPGNDVVQNSSFFTLIVINHDDAQVQQFIISENTIVWRWLNNCVPASSWRKAVFSDDLQKLNNRITALENKIGGVIKGLYIKLFSCFSDYRKVAI